MIIRKAIRAIRTFAIVQDEYGERGEVAVDYLAHVTRDNGKDAVIPLKLVPMDGVTGYQYFVVKDEHGKVIPVSEIERQFGEAGGISKS
jgi:hypothetical protein